MFLFSQRNPNSKFIGFMTDDCFFEDKIRYMFEELETKYIDLDYAVFSSCSTSYYPTPEHHQRFDVKDRLAFVTKLGDYKDLKVTKKWATNYLTDAYPIVSAKLLEVIGNVGWQVNIDATLALLNIILYQKYGINISFLLLNKSFDRLDVARKEKENPEPTPFNYEMKIDSSNNSQNPYLYVLTEQQAKNIYLNMKEDDVLNKYLINQDLPTDTIYDYTRPVTWNNNGDSK